MARPMIHQIAAQVAGLKADLEVIEILLPHLAEHARREHNELVGGLPTSEHGETMEGHGPPAYSDPTGESVVNFTSQRDGGVEPARLIEHLTRWFAAVDTLTGTTRTLLAQTPAMTVSVRTALREKRKPRPTDGRTATEHEQRRFVRVLEPHRCIVDLDHDEERSPNLFGPGELRRGLCDRHRKAYQRWRDTTPRNPLSGEADSDLLARWMAGFRPAPAAEPEQEQATVVDMATYRRGGRWGSKAA